MNLITYSVPYFIWFLFLAKEQREQNDFRHFFTIEKNRFFHSPTQTVYMIFRRPMDEAIQLMNRPAKEVICVNVNENCLEEVNQLNITLFCLSLFDLFMNRITLILAPISMSPTKMSSTDHLQRDVTDLSHLHQHQTQIRKSPKKRPLKRYTMVSSSSSSESLTSGTKGNQTNVCII